MSKSNIFKSCSRVMTTLLAVTMSFSAFGCAQPNKSGSSSKTTPTLGVSQPLAATNRSNGIGGEQADVWFAPRYAKDPTGCGKILL